jgi:hypothetical protein
MPRRCLIGSAPTAIPAAVPHQAQLLHPLLESLQLTDGHRCEQNNLWPFSPCQVNRETVVCDDAGQMPGRTLELLESDGRRMDLARHAASYAAQFTWERTVVETLSIYNELS